MTDMTVAKTILEQLGGRRFLVMTGAHSLTAEDNALTMALPQKGGRRRVKITLEPSDTYTLQVFRMVGSFAKGDLRVVEDAKHEDVYCDVLGEVFERATGLYISLGTMGRTG